MRWPRAAIAIIACTDVGREIALREQSVTLADEKVADVERRRDAVRGVQRGLAVAARVAVLDVVVDQRRLVEALHRHRDLAQRVRRRRMRVVPQRLVHADGEEGPPALAGPGELGAGQRLGLAGSGGPPNSCVERRGLEPALDIAPQRVEIEPAGPVVARGVDEVPDPFDVDGRVLAVVLQQRNRHAGIAAASM